MALPDTTINTMLRQDYLPEMPNLWAKKDYAMMAYLFQQMMGFDSNRIKVDVEYASASVATHVGVNDNVAVVDKEIATQGEQIAYLFLSTLRFNHVELLNMNTRADARRIMSRKMDNLLAGMREDFVKHFLTLSASSAQWLRAYDIIYYAAGALHGMTPSDFPDSTVWTPNSVNAATYGAQTTRDALMNEGENSYLPSLIRRLIAKCARHGDSSDKKIYVDGYIWSLLNDIIDAKKIGSLSKQTDAYLGIPQIIIDDIPVSKDSWLTYGRTANTTGIVYLIDHKHTKMRANRKAMFTLVGTQIPAQTNTSKVNQVGLYGNFTCDMRNANGFIYNLFSEYTYN